MICGKSFCLSKLLQQLLYVGVGINRILLLLNHLLLQFLFWNCCENVCPGLVS